MTLSTLALWGPTCPHCITPFRRRRVWLSGDGATCRTCFCRVEVLQGRTAGDTIFMFSGPDPRWRK